MTQHNDTHTEATHDQTSQQNAKRRIITQRRITKRITEQRGITQRTVTQRVITQRKHTQQITTRHKLPTYVADAHEQLQNRIPWMGCESLHMACYGVGAVGSASEYVKKCVLDCDAPSSRSPCGTRWHYNHNSQRSATIIANIRTLLARRPRNKRRKKASQARRPHTSNSPDSTCCFQRTASSYMVCFTSDWAALVNGILIPLSSTPKSGTVKVLRWVTPD